MKTNLLKIALIVTLLFFESCTKMKEPLVIGHRGAMGYEVENSLPSIQKALDMGVDGIEIDVFRLKSGETVVFHDETLDRLTNSGGRIEDYGYFDLRSVALSNGTGIPTLQEVLKLINNQVMLNIELKGANTADRVDHIVKYYIEKEGWSPENILVSSFRWDELRKFRELNKEIAIGILTEKDPLEALAIAKDVQAVTIHPEFGTLNEDNVKQIHKAGYKIYTWTVNEPEDIAHVKLLGVDGIITNYPDRVSAK